MSFCLFLDDELPSFPVDSKLMPSVKERVTKARQLDKMLLSSKKEVCRIFFCTLLLPNYLLFLSLRTLLRQKPSTKGHCLC